MADPTLLPNTTDIKRHLEVLFTRCQKDHPDALIQIDSGDPAGKKPWAWQYFKVTELDKATEYAAEQNLTSNVYVGVNPRKPETFPGTAARDDDILCAYLNFSDNDTKEATAAIKDTPIPYTFAVTTGRTPNKRGHFYWEREVEAINMKAWTDTQSGMADKFGSDRVIDPRRIMRLAGTINYPSAKKAERGYVTELVTIRTEYDDDRDPIDVIHLYNSFPAGVGAGRATGGEERAVHGLNLPTNATLDVEKEAREIMEGSGEWHNKMIRVVAHWVSAGRQDAEIILLCRNFTQAGYTDLDTDLEVTKAIRGARTKWDVPNPTPENIQVQMEEKHPGEITAFEVTNETLDPKNTPPREFIYGTHLIASYVAATISPGGVGKTTVALTDAIAIATGRQLTHDKPHIKAKAWHYNLEDPRDELFRRVIAIQQHFQIPKENIIGQLFLNSGRDQKLIVADRTPNGIIATPHAEQLSEAIKKNGIKTLSVDPFVKAHYADENDNKQIDDVLSTFAQIAHDTGCAIDLVHHVRKPAQGAVGVAGDINQARGASALSGAVRSARTITVMTDKEAEQFGILPTKKFWFIRLDDAKANMSPPSSGAYWLERQSVFIGNATMGDGDSVGVVEPWSPPGGFDNIDVAKAREIALAIDKHLPDGEMWSWQKQAQSRWVGNLIISMAINTSEAQAKEVVNTWLNTGLLVKSEYESGTQRKTRNCVEVDFDHLPVEEK